MIAIEDFGFHRREPALTAAQSVIAPAVAIGALDATEAKPISVIPSRKNAH